MHWIKYLSVIVLLWMNYHPASAQNFIRAYGDARQNGMDNSIFSQHYNSFFAFGTINGNIPSVSKIDLNGNLIWTRSYANGLYALDIVELTVPNQADPDLVLCMSKTAGNADIHVIRIKGTDGSMVWSYEYRPQISVRFSHLVLSSDNKIIINGVNSGNSGMFMAKLELDGSVIWSKRYSSSNSSEFAAISDMSNDFDGGAMFCYVTTTSSGFISVDSNGDIKFLKQLNDRILGRRISRTQEGFIIPLIADWGTRYINQGLLRIDSNLNVVWARKVNPVNPFVGTCASCSQPGAAQTPDGDFIYVQESALSGAIGYSVLKYSSTGQLLLSKRFNNNDVRFENLRSIYDGKILMSGSTTRSGLCMPASSGNGLFGVVSEDIDLCEMSDINIRNENWPVTLTPIAFNNVIVQNHSVQRNSFSGSSATSPFVASKFCQNEVNTIYLGPDTVVCGGGVFNINAGLGYNTYLWSTGASTSSINVTQSGTYSVRVTTFCNETLRDTIRITFASQSPITNNISVCTGQSYSIGNSIYTVSGQYRDTLKSLSGCDSIVITNLSVVNAFTRNIDTILCAGNSITVAGNLFNQSGNFTVNTTSVQGCDSIINLRLTILPVLSSVVNATICKGRSYTLGTNAFSNPGTYNVVLKGRSNCDSTVRLNLTVSPPLTATQNLTICKGRTITINGKSYSQSGTYVDTLKNPQGCDSILTTNLTVSPPLTATQNLTICKGRTITINGKSYSQSGTYVNTLKNPQGCDSILTTNLTVSPPLTSSQNATVCQGQFFVVNGNQYAASGVYKDTIKNLQGCDSILTTNLTVLPYRMRQQSIFICKGETLNLFGKPRTLTGVYSDTLKNAGSCDSIITTSLIVNDTFSVIIPAEICQGESFVFNGSTYTQSGLYAFQLNTLFGCDSSVYLDLKVSLKSSTSIDTSICAGEKIVVAGKEYSSTGTYSDTLNGSSGCDSLVTLNLEVYPVFSDSLFIEICQGQDFVIDGDVLNATGIYDYQFFSSTGCDSTVHVNLLVNPLPNAEAIADPVFIYAGESIELTGRPDDSDFNFSWEPRAIVRNPVVPVTVAFPVQSTWFVWNVIDQASGCEAKDSVFVEVFDACTLNIPNAFTPNRDGVNDCFQIVGNKQYKDFSCSIYNRWGEKVYEFYNPKGCWNGLTNGFEAPTDSYIYYIEYTCGDGESKSQKGTVTLIR
jgi:gliding motility-associated-like protein